MAISSSIDFGIGMPGREDGDELNIVIALAEE
jgi:hypothetical protein